MSPFAPPLPVVVGHRGAPRRAPENTPESFAAAVEDGASWVELDARCSADGVVVVHHDPETADGVAIIEREVSELNRLGVHTLADVLDGLPPGAGVDVECKNLPGQPDYDEQDELAERVAELLRARADTRPFMTSSFNPSTVAALAEALPDIPAGLLCLPTIPLPAAADVAREVGARLLCPHEDCEGLDGETVAHLRGGGFGLLVWTVDDPQRAMGFADAGIDAICTNDPAGIAVALGRR